MDAFDVGRLDDDGLPRERDRRGPHRYKQTALMTDLARAGLVEHIGRLEQELERERMVSQSLRRQLKEAHAGRGGRTGGAEARGSEPVPSAAQQPTVREVAASPEGARPGAVVEPGNAAVAADGRGVERPVPGPAAASSPATNAPVKRNG